MKIVILANDIGDKLWPLTSAKLPKALLALYSDNSMLTETIRRCAPLCSNKGKDIFIVATTESKAEIKARKLHTQFKIPLKNIITVDSHTGTTEIIQKMLKVFPESTLDSELVSFVPSDQFYWPEEGFIFHLSNSMEAVKENPGCLICMCMLPGMAAANMNYVGVDWEKESTVGTVYEYQSAADGGQSILSTALVPVTNYVRGTTTDTADDLMHKKYTWDLKTWVSSVGTYRELVTEGDFYDVIVPKLVQENKIKAALVNKVIWSVLDNWAALKYLTYEAGLFPVQEDAKVHTIDAVGNLVKRIADKEVVLIGVENLIIIETEDKLLVATPGGAYEHL
jgi:mannose-1-phosphate guanylyltransferase